MRVISSRNHLKDVHPATTDEETDVMQALFEPLLFIVKTLIGASGKFTLDYLRRSM
jgi:hypothetical protein